MPEQIPNEQDDKKYLVFSDWETMDTQQVRIALDAKRPAWLENLQPIGPNTLSTVFGPAAATANLPAGETIARQFFATFNGNDYIVAFCQSGSAYTINLVSKSVTKFAPAGTFSGLSDCTTWANQRILIADPIAGYSTYDGTVLVKKGGVSPNIIVTNGGSGYLIPPIVTFTGGNGSGATAVATIVGGTVTSIQLTNAGSGYQPGDVLTVVFSTGTASAIAIVWPFITNFPPTSLAVFLGRVWIIGGRVLQWTGTLGFDNVAPGNGAGQQTYTDADIVHTFTAIRALNNYLYIFGDNSVRQIGSIQVQNSPPNAITVFTTTTLTSDQGTPFPLSIVSYNRLVIFANNVGVWAIYGASVEKISDPMDGVFQNIDFTLPLVSVTNDLTNIRVLMVMARYVDPLQGPRTIFMTLCNKKWFVVSQGNNIRAAAQAPRNGVMQTWASSGGDVTQIVSSSTAAVACLLRTALSAHGKVFMGKRAIRIGVAHTAATATNITLTTDSESVSNSLTYLLAFPVTWLNALSQVVTWLNALSQLVTFVGSGFLFKPNQANASGIYLGASLSFTAAGVKVHNITIEYQEATVMRSINHA